MASEKNPFAACAAVALPSPFSFVVDSVVSEANVSTINLVRRGDAVCGMCVLGTTYAEAKINNVVVGRTNDTGVIVTNDDIPLQFPLAITYLVTIVGADATPFQLEVMFMHLPQGCWRDTLLKIETSPFHPF